MAADPPSKRDLTVYWCPRCEIQCSGPWHTCARVPLIPQENTETKCERIEVVPKAAVVSAEAEAAEARTAAQAEAEADDEARASLSAFRERITMLPGPPVIVWIDGVSFVNATKHEQVVDIHVEQLAVVWRIADELAGLLGQADDEGWGQTYWRTAVARELDSYRKAKEKKNV